MKHRPLSNRVVEIGKFVPSVEVQREYMGVDWPMTLRELSEAVPPAYTEFIGIQLSAYLRVRVGAEGQA